VYVADANGANRHVVYTASDTRSPVWSPDGSQIAFYHRYNGWKYLNGGLVLDDFFQVIVVRVADGSYWIPSNQPNHSYSPSWSPTGQSLVFSGDNGLYLVSATSPAQTIPNTSFQFTTPSWSPDGRQIAFTMRNHDHWDIGVINPDGTGLSYLTSGSTDSGPAINSAAASWSPDGNRLAFISDRTGNWIVYIMNRDGTNVEPTTVGPVTYTGSYDRVLAWKM
jgi:TolB protein